jgi:hypothetical protein
LEEVVCGSHGVDDEVLGFPKDSFRLGADRSVRSEQRSPLELSAGHVCFELVPLEVSDEDWVWVGEDELVDLLAQLREKFLEREVRCLFKSDRFLAFVWAACDFKLLPGKF